MGQEFAQPGEWNHDAQLPWPLLDDARHAGVQALVRELNGLYRARPALHALDCQASGFEWLVADDAAQSVFAWLRRDDEGDQVVVLCNFTPVPRAGYRVGIDGSASRWRIVLDTDASAFGGSGGYVSTGIIAAEHVPAHGRPESIVVDLPPLATLFLVPA
jgi:1,4-alpha-glucan branching enzyme